MIRRVIDAPVEDDGLTFDPSSLRSREIREEQEYGGIRVRLVALLGNARVPMQIDVGFGDAITPAPQVREYPTLLEMEAPRLRMYPPETVVAEKIEAIVTLGMINTRMKDFFDLLVLLRDDALTDDRITDAVIATFGRRQTPLPPGVPPGLSDEYGTDEQARRLWREFLRRMQIEDAQEDFAVVVADLRGRIWPMLDRARKSESA